MMDLVDAVEGAAGGEEYINGAARKVAAAVRSGKAYPEAAPRDNQLHGLVRLPIVVARYVGAPLPPGPAPVAQLRVSCPSAAFIS